MIAGKGAHKTFDLGEDSIVALASAVSAIEQDPAAIREFPITPELTLVCEPSRRDLVNYEAKYCFVELKNLKELSDRLHESALIARIFN